VLLGGRYVREKRIGASIGGRDPIDRYLCLVESVREGGRTRQRIIKNLGRKEHALANGDLDRLARSAARMAQRSMILSLLDQGSAPALVTYRIGPPLAFERPDRGRAPLRRKETGCRAVIEDLAAARGFDLSLERACFLSVPHRLMVSSTGRHPRRPDRAADAWREDCRIEGTDDLALHHLYRARRAGWGPPTPSRPASWAGSARSCRTPSRRSARRSPRAASRTWWRSGCSKPAAWSDAGFRPGCSASSRWSSWIPPACTSRGRAARSIGILAPDRPVSGATPRACPGLDPGTTDPT